MDEWLLKKYERELEAARKIGDLASIAILEGKIAAIKANKPKPTAWSTQLGW